MTDYQICLTVVAIVFYVAGFLIRRKQNDLQNV